MASTTSLITAALRTISIESRAISALKARIDESFEQACDIMLNCNGRVIVTGMGKSGHICNKIAATLASTGTPAFFMHPGEASHGDLGMVTEADVVLAISYSGTTQELLTILPLIKRRGATLISMTGSTDSPLAKEAKVHLNVAVSEEACPLGLAPTSSTTAALVMGDALAVSMLEARGFSAEDFAFSHPGGALGRRLLLKIADIMHKGDTVPRVNMSTPLREALIEISAKKLGMTTVVNNSGELVGVFTDGDLRRALDHNLDIHATQTAEAMTKNCVTISEDLLAAEAVALMEKNAISALVVVDSNNMPIGALNTLDLLRAGVI